MCTIIYTRITYILYIHTYTGTTDDGVCTRKGQVRIFSSSPRMQAPIIILPTAGKAALVVCQIIVGEPVPPNLRGGGGGGGAHQRILQQPVAAATREFFDRGAHFSKVNFFDSGKKKKKSYNIPIWSISDRCVYSEIICNPSSTGLHSQGLPKKYPF